jgi:replicative DNA helicase
MLNTSEETRFLKVGDRFMDARLFIDDTPNQSMLQIGANARRLKHRAGVRLVVIDYLQLVEPEDRKAPRHEQVGAISRRLKLLARELQIPVIAMAQLNRASEGTGGNGRKPRLSDLRESGSIEADADLVVLLHRLEEADGERESADMDFIEAIVAKQRNGPTDELTLAFRRHCQRFESVAEEGK